MKLLEITAFFRNLKIMFDKPKAPRTIDKIMWLCNLQGIDVMHVAVLHSWKQFYLIIQQ